MKPALEIFCNGLLAALLNGVYQGIFVMLLAGLYLKLGHRLNAATRHGALLATLSLVVLLPLLHFSISKNTLPTPEATPQELGSDQALEIAESAASPGLAETGPEEPNEMIGSAPHLAGALHSAFQRLSSFGFPRVALSSWTSIALVVCWMTVSLILLSRLAYQLCFLRSWKRAGKPAPAEFCELFHELCVELNVKRRAQLLLSDQTSTPIAAGFHHAAVLLPGPLFENLDLTRARQVLRHEIAHLARYDDWANLLQQIAKSVFFFHPGVWVLDRQLTLQREIACDDQVLAAATDPRSYALFLTEFASRPHRRQLTAVTAAWSNKGQLKERINMILNSQRNSSPRLARARVGVLTLGAAIIALLAVRAGPRVLFAQETSPADAAQVSASRQEQKQIDLAAGGAGSIASADAPSVRKSLRERPDIRIASADDTVATTEGGPKPKPGAAVGDDSASDATQARAASRKDRDDLSIERRIERLEKLVKTLVAREKGKNRDDIAAGPPREPKQLAEPKGPMAEMKPGRITEKELKYSKLNDGEIARIMDQAKMEVEHGRREAERAIKEAQRAIAESSAAARVEGLDGFNHYTLEAQHHALEAQHAALERQMRALEKQMSRLERDKEKMEKDGERKKRAKADEPDEHESHKGEGSGEANKK